jgi:hypothetical protein
MVYIGEPGAISQTNDAVFHLNALRWIAETGSASSFDLSGVVGSASFYPAAWHAWTSLVAVAPGLAPIAVNMVSLVIAAVIWPLGIASLVGSFGGAGARTVAFAAALAGGMRVFPQLMFEWGVLYPYALAVSLTPVAIALCIRAMRSGPRRNAISFGIAALAASVAIALSQPASLLVVILFALTWAVMRMLPRRRGAAVSLRGGLAAVIGGSALLVGLWALFVYSTGPVLWRGYRSAPRAALDMVLNSQSQVPPAIMISILMGVGMMAVVRRRSGMWLLFAWAATAVLYVVAVGPDLPMVKRILTGPWYGDSFRLAAIVPVAAVPLAAIGMNIIVSGCARRWRRADEQYRSAMPILGAIVVATTIWLVITPVSQLRIGEETDRYTRYSMNARTYLSIDEYALLRRLPQLIPADALLIANPSTGAAFAYSLGDREIIPRTWSPPDTAAWWTIADRLRDAGEDPEICEALAAYGAPGYVLDFGRGGTRPGEYVMRGMTDFKGQPGFEKVDSVGRASLWRITACGG